MTESKMPQKPRLLKNSVRNEVIKVERRFEVLRTLMSILIALAIVFVIITLVSDEPVEAIQQLIFGPVSTLRRFADVIRLMIPLTFCGLAITMVFKTNRFNLASDSAFYMGSIVAVLIAVFAPMPGIVKIPVALLAGFLVGSFIGFIPAILNRSFGASELVTSLMLNYVVGFLVNYLFNYVARDPSKAALQSYALPNDVSLGEIIPRTDIHYGLVIAIAVVIVCYLILNKTKWGYALRMTGQNQRFAKYAGIQVGATVLTTQALGTGIAGLGGAVEMIGNYRSFKWAASPGYGFDGIIIATLAHNKPLGIPFAAFFLAYIRVGADIMNRTSDVPAEIVSIVQATIILLIAAQAFLSNWKQKAIVKKSGALDEKKEA